MRKCKDCRFEDVCRRFEPVLPMPRNAGCEDFEAVKPPREALVIGVKAELDPVVGVRVFIG